MKQHRKITLRILFLLAATLAWSVVIYAQTVTGTLQGTVTDSTGGVVPGADVLVRNLETGQERNLKTNAEGSYSAAFLPLGRYSVAASSKGFSKIVQENIEITLNQTRVIDIKLSPVGITEAVLVTAEAAPINTTNGEIKGSLNSQEILDKPTANQGSFLTLAETFAGFQENPTSGQNNPTASSGSSINFNGTGTRGATFQINGVNNDDSSENQNRQGASLSTIKEFQVITNNYTAEFGRGYGAVVLVQTKSGTNNLHGDFYLYHNDSALNATNNVFNPSARKGVTRRNQFGFTSGFPVLKNKLFGFVSLDHTENTGANAYNRDVFTADERNPANWFKQTPANDTPANRAFVKSVMDRFANAVPNDPAAGPRVFRGQQGFNFPARDYSGRFDFNPWEADNISGRWQYTRQRFAADDIILGERADQNHKQQNFGLTWTHLFSAKTVGEFRYGRGLRTTLVNITAGNDTPIIRFFNPTPITTQSSLGSAGNFPIQRYQDDNQFVYNITTLFDKHYFKAGTDIRRQKLDDLADNFSRGFYSSTVATCNGINYTNGFNQFINGCTPNFQKGYGPFFLENRINEANFYAEDNWKVRENLTLNIGLRYEYISAPKEARGRINYGISADKDNWEPRVGFAWGSRFEGGLIGRLFGRTDDAVIRGGYGIYHGRIFQSVFSQGGATVRFNPPNAFFYNQSGVASSTFNPNDLSDPTRGFVFVPGPQTVRHTITEIDPGLEMPYTQQWNLTFERKMPFTSILKVSYTGTRGIGIIKYTLNNLPLHDPVNGVRVANSLNNPANLRGQVIKLASDFVCAGTTTALINAQCPNVVPIGEFEYSFRVPRVNERRPNGLYSTNTAISNNAWSYYNALQVDWTKRLSRNLSFQAAYTWSKALDTNSEATFVGAGDSNQNGNDKRAIRGFSRFHTPHRFTIYGTYRLPFFRGEKGLLGQTLGGWQFSSVVKLSKGTPFTATTTALDLNFDGFSESRPVLLDPSILGNSVNLPATSQAALPRAAFRTLTIADFNTPLVGRNTFFADGVKNVDFGLMKNFPMPWGEGHKLSVRADFFNAFNHVQYGIPSAVITSTNFGAITGTAVQYAPRSVQVSLRYQY
jgi:hypothetical protein